MTPPFTLSFSVKAIKVRWRVKDEPPPACLPPPRCFLPLSQHVLEAFSYFGEVGLGVQKQWVYVNLACVRVNVWTVFVCVHASMCRLTVREQHSPPVASAASSDLGHVPWRLSGNFSVELFHVWLSAQVPGQWPPAWPFPFHSWVCVCYVLSNSLCVPSKIAMFLSLTL